MKSSGLDDLAASPCEPLARHTSLKVGGPADLFYPTRTAEQAIAALAAAQAAGLPIRVLGGGSNLLASDEGVAGLVIKYLAAQHEILSNGDRATLVAEAGCSFPALARRVSKTGWAGLEWAVNVPGTVGGAVVNNAGAFGSSVVERVIAVELAEAGGRVRRLARDELQYEYRNSRLKRRELGEVVVLRAEFDLSRGDAALLQQTVARTQEMRTRTQPRQLSAGSVFANPEGDFAGRLIEQAGLKGTRHGGAQISPQHANFIVNVGKANAQDVYILMRTAQEAVRATSGVWLRPEIELIGRWSPEQLARLREPGDAR